MRAALQAALQAFLAKLATISGKDSKASVQIGSSFPTFSRPSYRKHARHTRFAFYHPKVRAKLCL